MITIKYYVLYTIVCATYFYTTGSALGFFQLHYNPMGPPLRVWSVVIFHMAVFESVVCY